MSTIPGRKKVFGAILKICECTVSIVRSLQGSVVKSKDFDDIEKWFLQLEENVLIVNEIMPTSKQIKAAKVHQIVAAGDAGEVVVEDDNNDNNDDDEDENNDANDNEDIADTRRDFNHYNTYHLIRYHWRYFLENFGSLEASDQTSGEFQQGRLRDNVHLTNMRGMAYQQMYKHIMLCSILATVTGCPYLLFDGEELSTFTAEQRIEYFVKSAERQQLLIPGSKLTKLLEIIPTDNVEDEEWSTRQGQSNKLAKLLREQLSASLLFPVVEKAVRPRFYMYKNHRKIVCNWSDIENQFYSHEALLNILGEDVINREQYLSADRYNRNKRKLMLEFFQMTGVDKEADFASAEYYSFTQLVTSHHPVEIGDNVQIKGGRNEWYCKVLGIYLNTKAKSDNARSVNDKCAVLVMYYEQILQDHPVYQYPLYKPSSIDIVRTSSIVSHAHLFSEIPEFTNVVFRDPEPHRIKILNKYAKFPKFW
jgi:hypothetical protein